MSISFSPTADREHRARGAGVTAVLGPTNTGKTHLAIERMLAHSSGIIGLPLRLVARRGYTTDGGGGGRAAGGGAPAQASPRARAVAFVAIDEIQLGADLERGHVFTDRMLNRRGREETLVLGAATVRPMIERLPPGAKIPRRP